MQKVWRLLFFVIVSAAVIAPAAALDNVKEIDSVDQLSSDSTLNLSNVTAVHAAAYYCDTAPCPADGGEGLFLKHGSMSDCTTDFGRVIRDSTSAHNCWYRQNLNGDLRQWGE